MAERDNQLYLFSTAEQRKFKVSSSKAQYSLELGSHSLQKWKTEVADYQQQVRLTEVEQQGALFDWAEASIDPAVIDPFYLQLHNFLFFEWPASQHPSRPCIYFVIDTTIPLILYIGETCKANQRWKGVHDCKRYVSNYQSLHYQHGISTAINTAFYWDTPAQTRPRQKLELGLILRWRSPFNKENWDFWGTPFIGEK